MMTVDKALTCECPYKVAGILANANTTILLENKAFLCVATKCPTLGKYKW